MRLNYVFLFILINSSIIFANSLNLNLDNDVYLPFGFLSGNIFLNLSSNLDLGLDPKLVISIGNYKEGINAVDLFRDLDSELNINDASVEVKNPQKEKELDLSKQGLIGVKLPKGSEIKSMDFDITSVNKNGFSEFPYLDFFNDNLNDWFYGQFLSWTDEYVIINGQKNLNVNQLIVEDDSALNCGVMDLPFSDKFNVTIDIKVDDESGNISLQIFDFDNTTNSIKDKYGDCTLKNIKGSSNSGCIINTNEFLSGEHLLCFYNDKKSGSYSLDLDDKGDNSYSCNPAVLIDNSGDCILIKEGDFFMRAYKPKLDGLFNSKSKFSDFTPDFLIDDINIYLENCEEDQDGKCSLYLGYGSYNNKGSLILNNLDLQYYSQGLFKLNNFYDVNSINANINGFKNGSKIVDYKIVVPLSLFENLTVPNLSANNNILKINVKLGELYDEENIIVDKNLFSSQIFDIDLIRTDLRKLENDPNIDEFLRILKIDLLSLGSTLDEYKSQLEQINEDVTLNQNQKKEQIDLAKAQIDQIVNLLPKSVQVVEDIEFPRIYPENIDPGFLNGEKEEEVLSLQDEVDINSNIKLFSLTYNNGNKVYKTFVKRTLNSEFDDYYIIEDISKEVISSANNILFEGSNYNIINEDPVIKWNLNGNSEINYVIDGNVLNKLDKIKTIVISKKISTQNYQGALCGDNICTEILEDEILCPEDCKPKYKINWLVTSILLLVLILGAIYFNFFMNKRNLKDIFKSKKPNFVSLNDESNLRDYVLKSLKNNVPKIVIYKNLLSKKWTQEQVNYIFNKIDKPVISKKNNILNKIINKFREK